MDIFTTTVLSLSGLALLYAGVTRLATPEKTIFLVTYLANPANQLSNNIDLANEIRGVGAVMLLSGGITLLGTAVIDLRLISLIVANLVFFGAFFGRLISWFADGKPTSAIIRVTIVEGFLGILNLYCLLHFLR
ncbi:MAG: DUF4345 domain-containing protein [Bacteroidota bacterium]